MSDAPSMSAMLVALTEAGKRTRSSDEAFVRESYVANPDGLRCTVAVEDGRVFGLQIVTHAVAGNPWGAPEGSATIGTHVAPWAARRGVGKALFQENLAAIKAAGVTRVEAYIQKSNDEGHAYYGAMGFEPDREDGTALIRVLTL